MSAKIHFQSQDIKLSDFLIMDNEDPEFCWAKTVRGQSPNRFFLTMAQSFTIVLLGDGKNNK